VSDDADVRCAGRLFQRLAAETGKARLPTVVRLKTEQSVGRMWIIGVLQSNVTSMNNRPTFT